MAKPLEREGVLAGYTYKIRWPGCDHAMYITINDIEVAGPAGGGPAKAPALRDLHQLQEPRALRLDGGADAHDQRHLPPRRRRLLRGRGAQGRVRSPGRPVDGRPLRAEPARRHRRGDRDAHDPHRLPGAPAPAGRGGGLRPRPRRLAAGDRRDPTQPQTGRARACPRCGSQSLRRQEGCLVCGNCGYSKCS